MHFPTQAVLGLLATLPIGMAIPLFQPAAAPYQAQRVPPRPHYRHNHLKSDEGPAIVANGNYNVPMVTGVGIHPSGTVGTGFATGTAVFRGTGIAYATGASGRMPMATGAAIPSGSTGTPIVRRALIGGHKSGWNGTSGTGVASIGTASGLQTGSVPLQTAPMVSAPSGRPVHMAALHRRIANASQPDGGITPSGTAPVGTAASSRPLVTGTPEHQNTTGHHHDHTATAAAAPEHTGAERIETRATECNADEIRCNALDAFSQCEDGEWTSGGKVEAGRVCMGGRLKSVVARAEDGDCATLGEGATVCAEDGAMHGTCRDGVVSPLEVVKRGQWCVHGQVVDIARKEKRDKE